MLSKANQRKKIRRLHNRLGKEYGIPVWEPGYDPLTELIFTVLSQHTSDKNRDTAFARLQKRFPKWEVVRDAPGKAVESAIHSAGLGRIKSARIKALLRTITDRYGKLSLDFLQQLPTVKAKEILLSLDGVGPKTTACVLLFSLARPVFPVDTHIFRVSKRVGLIPAKSNPDDAHRMMQELVPGKLMYPFHINLIQHGRAVCKSSRPLCERCCIKDNCNYYLIRPNFNPKLKVEKP
ncbi:MAG: endonuclease III [bacterium]|nr:endonuclease III [bacterium]